MSDLDHHGWLLIRERGEDISHIPAATRAAYDELTRLIAALPDLTPSPGWKQRALAAIDQPPAVRSETLDDLQARDRDTHARPGPKRRIWATAASLAAAAAVVIVIATHGGTSSDRASASRESLAALAPPFRDSPPPSELPTVIAEIRRGDRPHRSGRNSASIGDTLVLRTDTWHPIELRVYGDAGEPLARCTERQGCAVEHDGDHRRFRFELALHAAGDVRTVLFTGAAVPAAFENLDADVEAAQRAGVDARQVAIIHVQ
jgi:hypothetical protein